MAGLARPIAEQPRRTEELATLVGMTESGLSKHLPALVEAGLLTQRRQGYYLLYALERGTLAELPGELQTFIENAESREL